MRASVDRRAGFFGITYQGATNGLASLTLSIYNVVRSASRSDSGLRICRHPSSPYRSLPIAQDHPDDVAWTKHVFDFVAGKDGALTMAQIPEFLTNFYRARKEGATISGAYLYTYPHNELAFLEQLFTSAETTLEFPRLLDALKEAQAQFAEPSAPLEYGSAAVLRSDKTKHTRCVLHPQQKYRKPMATSQEVGWELYTAIEPESEPTGTPFRLRTSATTQFADAMEKQTWGRSIGGEFSAYATRKLVEFGGQGMGV